LFVSHFLLTLYRYQSLNHTQMKKIILSFIAAFCSLSAFGQVEYQKLSLQEAIEKSKATNKLVMVIASATW